MEGIENIEYLGKMVHVKSKLDKVVAGKPYLVIGVYKDVLIIHSKDLKGHTAKDLYGDRIFLTAYHTEYNRGKHCWCINVESATIVELEKPKISFDSLPPFYAQAYKSHRQMCHECIHSVHKGDREYCKRYSMMKISAKDNDGWNCGTYKKSDEAIERTRLKYVEQEKERLKKIERKSVPKITLEELIAKNK